MLNIQRNYSEKRDFIRMNLNSHFQFRKQSSPTTTHQGVTRNLSGKGIQFETASQIKLNEELQITINPTAGQFNPLQAKVQVVRIESLAANYILVACKIIEIG